MSTYNSILSVVHDTIVNLALSGISNSNIVIKKLPKAEENLDTLPTIMIAPMNTPEQVKRFGFESTVSINYRVEVVIIAAGNLDLTSADLPTYFTWRESIRKVFQQLPLSTLGLPANIWDINVEMEVPIDRRLINELYDYMGMAIIFRSIETQA